MGGTEEYGMEQRGGGARRRVTGFLKMNREHELPEVQHVGLKMA